MTVPPFELLLTEVFPSIVVKRPFPWFCWTIPMWSGSPPSQLKMAMSPAWGSVRPTSERWVLSSNEEARFSFVEQI